jgi:hypothetical protein
MCDLVQVAALTRDHARAGGRVQSAAGVGDACGRADKEARPRVVGVETDPVRCAAGRGSARACLRLVGSGTDRKLLLQHAHRPGTAHPCGGSLPNLQRSPTTLRFTNLESRR